MFWLPGWLEVPDDAGSDPAEEGLEQVEVAAGLHAAVGGGDEEVAGGVEAGDVLVVEVAVDVVEQVLAGVV